MDTPLWSDDEFRSFLFSMRNGVFGPTPDEFATAAFIEQARLRVAPDVQRRVLSEVGAATDASGIARAALALLEDEAYGRRRTWLLVSPDPWGVLTDLVVREVRASYRATVRRSGDRRALAGIEVASSRVAIEAGEEDDDEVDAAEAEALPDRA